MRGGRDNSLTNALGEPIEAKLQQFEETIALTNATVWDYLATRVVLIAGMSSATGAVYMLYANAESGIFAALPDPVYWLMFAGLAGLIAHSVTCAAGLSLVARRRETVEDVYAELDVDPPEEEP